MCLHFDLAHLRAGDAVGRQGCPTAHEARQGPVVEPAAVEPRDEPLAVVVLYTNGMPLDQYLDDLAR